MVDKDNNIKNKSTLLGQILVANNRITKEQLDKALQIQNEMDEDNRKPLGQILLELDYVDPNDIIEAIRVQVQMRAGDTAGISPSKN